MDEIQDIDKHIVLYAKGHYKTTKAIDDIWQLICEWSGMDKSTPVDALGVFQMILRTIGHCNVNQQTQWDCFRSLWRGEYNHRRGMPWIVDSITPEEQVQCFLSMVRHLKITDIPWIQACQADSKYLPISPSRLNYLHEEQRLLTK